MNWKTTSLLTLTLLTFAKGFSQCNGATFEEENGIAVIQAESVSLTGSWQRQTSFSGYTGSSYIVWTGTEYFNTPGNGTLNYTVRINTPGTYRFVWRSRVGIGNIASEHNDTWLRIQGADDFYGQRGSSRVYPRGSGKTPNPAGSSADGWLKVYMSSVNWVWQSKTSDNDPHDIYARFDNPGNYTIQLSARSRGHLIDRMVLYQENRYSSTAAQNNTLAETRCDGSTTPPPSEGGGTNNPPTVTITNPTNGQSISAGSDVSVNLSASDTDGSINRHQIYLNSALVDTDGSSYTPHIIRNIANGSYTVRAVVTDNVGATAESSVTFTVGSGTTPPAGGGGNQLPTVQITSPTSGQNFATGSDVVVRLSASDPDGSVTRHQIFVNGSLVDTDGTSYTPHTIRNIASGNYVILARVTDNAGASTESSVNITVGSGTPPPPPPPSSGVTFTLIDAGSDQTISTLTSGATISNGSSRNIRAQTTATNVGSAFFALSGAQSATRVENVAPYALFGDVSGNYNAHNFAAGNYTLQVTFYSGANRTGSILDNGAISFSVGSSTSSKEAITDIKATAYPNPVEDGNLTVKLPTPMQGKVVYQVMALNGQMVDSGVLDLGTGSDTAQLNLQGLARHQEGIYYLYLSDGTEAISVPLAKK